MRLATAVQDFLVSHPGYRQKPATGYGLAVVCVAVTLGIRLATGAYIGGVPFITFFPAVMVATFIGGRGPGLAAAVLGGLAAWYFLLPPTFSFALPDLGVAAGLVLYFLVAVMMALLFDALIKIAEQNAALARKAETLLVELQHRVKNHIQIVASLLNLQARRAEPAVGAALADAARRINTLSSAYAHLYRSDLKVDFAQHLRDIADAAASAARGHRAVDVKSDDVTWGMDHVMPVSLIASELIDNALRHGLTEGQGGVEVTLHRAGEGYTLRVVDTGGRLPPQFDPSRSTGLGLQLVNAMARRVQGVLRTEAGPLTVFVLEFAAPPEKAA